MSQSNTEFFERFPLWLASLGQDAELLVNIAALESLATPAREQLVGGVHYLFKTLDLIPDGIDEIGYLDDAFVLRVAAELAVMEAGMGGDGVDETTSLQKLGDDCELIREFLGDDYPRLRNYVKGLRHVTARGRSVQDVLQSSDAHAALTADVTAFSASFVAPTFRHEEKNLIKMRAFFNAKLPR